ncbi:MAG: RluA family pseudouridine synthase, partial [Bacilli bacterium]|nr:RluA family pseudouridine synthase [Bacilli bacterium]
VATITTGRTHQIRVHMAYLNHPIIGDKIYGSGDKLMLESFYLGFLSPINNKYLEIKIDNELEF